MEAIVIERSDRSETLEGGILWVGCRYCPIIGWDSTCVICKGWGSYCFKVQGVN